MKKILWKNIIFLKLEVFFINVHWPKVTIQTDEANKEAIHNEQESADMANSRILTPKSLT